MKRATRRVLLGLTLAATAVVGAWALFSPRGAPPASTEREWPFVPRAKSRFLNTGPDAHFVGAAACAACHRANHASFLHTAHSRALADVDPALEPPDGAFDHAPSRRSYRVHRKDGRLWHEETVRDEAGRELTRIDLPVRYRVGSGRFSQSYLVEIDGYLTESPVTWFASTKRWDMSPGYDAPRHNGFERPVTANCMFCHAGRIETSDDSPYRLRFAEMAVSCESCHGPGSLHAERHRDRPAVTGGEDPTIVNPRRLERSLQEDLCATCHLGAAIFVPLRGRTAADFRPGLPLNDVRIDYEFDADVDAMTVTGHVGQMRASACHKNSAMTCLTCHDPHGRTETVGERVDYRAKCLACHDGAGGLPGSGKGPACSLPVSTRLATSPADDCASCHMPRGATEIQHIAFHHHRIGIHGGAKPPRATGVPNLVPVEDIGHLAPEDRRRSLAIALLEVRGQRLEFSGYGETLRERARPLLEEVYAAGLRDGDVLQKLVEVHAKTDSERAARFADEILAMKSAPLTARAGALSFLSFRDMKARDPRTAIPRLEALIRLYPTSEHFMLLGSCLVEVGRTTEGVAALERSVALRPTVLEAQDALAEAYRRLGDESRAQATRETAAALRRRWRR